MTITLTEIAIYAFALAVLVLTPGPVVVATIAKTLASGIRSALPLAAGVSIVDMLWPLLAILGLSALVEAHAGALQVLRYLGGAILVWMGVRLILRAGRRLDTAPDPALIPPPSLCGLWWARRRTGRTSISDLRSPTSDPSGLSQAFPGLSG